MKLNEMSIDHYLKKIVSASNGPLLAEKLADAITADMIKQRKGKKSFLKSYAKSKYTKKFENLESALLRIMRQTTDENRVRYAKVIDRIHSTGMDTLFIGPIPLSIKQQTELESNLRKEQENISKDTDKIENL